MIIELSLIQNFLLAISVVSTVVVVIFLVSKLFKHHKKIKETEPDLGTGYKKLLKTANKHAQSVLYKTTVEATNILTGAKITNEHLEENVDRILQTVAQKDIQTFKELSEKFEKDYTDKINKLQEQIDQNTKKALTDIQNSYSQKLDQFSSELIKSGASTQSVVDKKTAELITKAETEIEEYKKSQFAKIEGETKALVEKVYKQVLRVSIPESVHQDLILKSLEDAKRDGLFRL